MRFSDELIEKIKYEADIVEIISYDLNLKKSGNNFITLSPFKQEKTPSFVVSPEKQIFKDFSSGKSGNVITFIMEYHRLTFPEALEFLAKRLGIELGAQVISKDFKEKESKRTKLIKIIKDINKHYIYTLNLNENKHLLEYFYNRGFSAESISLFKLGYSPDDWNTMYNEMRSRNHSDNLLQETGVFSQTKNNSLFDKFRGRLTFPIRDHTGNIVGFGGRIVNDKTSKVAKYINTPSTLLYDKSKILYGLYEGLDYIRNTDKIIIVEGYADVIMLHQNGFKNVVAASGTSLTEEQVRIIKRYVNKVVLIFDSDDAGIIATNRAIELCLKNEIDVKICHLPNGEDPDSFLKKFGTERFEKELENALNFIQFKVKIGLKNRNLNPIEKSKFLKECINLISIIPDKLSHNFYLTNLANEADISVNQLHTSYTENSKFSFINNENTIETDNISTILQKLKSELHLSEILLLKFLLEDIEKYNYLVSEHNIGSELFISELAKRIFDLTDEIDTTINKSSGNQLIEMEIDFELKDKITSILMFNDILSLSENWERYRNYSIETNWKKEAEDCISKLRLESIELERKELQKEIQNVDEENKLKILKRIQQLGIEREKIIGEKI